jgi:hypothetical protein
MNEIVQWKEIFSEAIAEMIQTEAKGPGGRPHYDYILCLKCSSSSVSIVFQTNRLSIRSMIVCLFRKNGRLKAGFSNCPYDKS